MRQPRASAALIARSTACSFSTGSDPGSARHTGHVLLFGEAPKSVEQRQKIFVAVLSWTCTSSPTTISYVAAQRETVAEVIGALRLRAAARAHRPRRTFDARRSGWR